MNKSDLKRDYGMLDGSFAKQGYDWWWHNFTGVNAKTGEEKSFFIEYFTCNPKLANQSGGGIKTPGEEAICGQLEKNKAAGVKPSYLMVKAGWWGLEKAQLHRFIPWKDVELSNDKEGYKIKALDCFASETALKGSVEIALEDSVEHSEWMCNAGSMQWDLKVSKKVTFNVGYGAGALFRKLKAFEMYWHAEGMKTEYSGTVIANGVEYIIKPEVSFGYADKNWGSNFTSPWVWLSSNDLVSKITGKKLQDSVFDIGGGKPKVFGIALDRKLLSDFWYEGKSYEFNFSQFWTFCRTSFDCKETDSEIVWFVRQETVSAVMETEIRCKKQEMLLVNYESPDGEKRHNRLWNGGTGEGTVKLWKKAGSKKVLLDEIEAKHVGCEFGEYC
ncbi:MAG: hypothetical protein MJ188_00535 [Treponema sp.]|nr:hypothetical protein [Treponema sp.]